MAKGDVDATTLAEVVRALSEAEGIIHEEADGLGIDRDQYVVRMELHELAQEVRLKIESLERRFGSGQEA